VLHQPRHASRPDIKRRNRHNHFIRRVHDRYGVRLTLAEVERLEARVQPRGTGSGPFKVKDVNMLLHWKEGTLTTAYEPTEGPE
jgi:hypothetical protein